MVQNHFTSFIKRDSEGEVYESDWVKGRDDMLRTSDVRWTDSPTERLFIIGHPNSRARALIEFIHLQFDEII